MRFRIPTLLALLAIGSFLAASASVSAQSAGVGQIMMGLTAGGCWLAKGALAASQRQDEETADADSVRILETRYFAENHLPQARGYSSVVRGSADAFFATTPDAISL